MATIEDTAANNGATTEYASYGSVAALEAKKEAVIRGLTDYNRYTYQQLGAHSSDEAASTAQTIERMRSLSADDLLAQKDEIENHFQWLTMDGGISDQRVKIEDAWDKMNAMLEEAVRSKGINEKSRDRWIKRFKNKNHGASVKIEFVNIELPVLLTRAEKIATKRKEIMKTKEFKDVNENMVPDLAAFVSEDSFLDLHYLDKENLTLTVDAAATAAKKMPALYSKAKGILDRAIDTGAMSKRKVGKWMQSLFKTNRTPNEIQAILEGELKDYIGSWTKLRYQYDRIERLMDKHGVPQGFNRLSQQKFLDLDYFQRESYVEEAERNLNISLNGPSDKPIDQLKMEIRQNLQTKDWEEAGRLIGQARSIAEGEDVLELNSMENYLKQFRKGESTQSAPLESVTKTLEGMREALTEAPASVQMLYMDALNRGATTMSALSTQMYNLVWCHDHGYLNEDKEERLYQQSFDETEDIVENGHRQYGLENINLNAVDDNKKGEAMRPYRTTWAPTLYHMSCSDGSARARYLNELLGKNVARDYWSTLKIRDISYEKQAYLVKNVNWKLKSGIRKLQAAGVAFTLNGPPEFVK